MGMIMIVSMVFVVIMMVVVQLVAGFKITLSANTLYQKLSLIHISEPTRPY